MSQSLERVIAEQQKEIDRLRGNEHVHAEGWQRHHKKLERLVSAAFSVLDEPAPSPEDHFELKQAIMSLGYCPTCESAPCECEYD